MSGHYRDATDFVDNAALQRSVDYPDEYPPDYYVVQDDLPLETGLNDQAGQPQI